MPVSYIIPINPQPALRARAQSKVNGKPYTPEQYRDYQARLKYAINKLEIPHADYAAMIVTYFIPIPKTRKKKYKAGTLHRVKPDEDNLNKALKDTLEKCKVFKNDQQIGASFVSKVWCGLDGGLIHLTLYTEQEWYDQVTVYKAITETSINADTTGNLPG